MVLMLPATVHPAEMFAQTLRIRTAQPLEFIDISDDVREIVRDLGVQDGLVLAFSCHTTAALRINEREPLLLEDMARVLAGWAPPGNGYGHDDFSIRTVNMHPNERPNGHSHCQALSLNTSEMLPVSGGELLLGEWQSLFLVELDGPRDREVVIQIWSASARAWRRSRQGNPDRGGRLA